MEDQAQSFNLYPMSKRTRLALETIKKDDSKPYAELFKAISDPARLKIIKALGQRELCVCVLVDLTGVQYSTLSYHLKLLRDVDLIDSDKDGSYILYSLTATGKMVYKFIQKLADTC
ncbi:MAG TPA: metalloregulator ArsR/SmtB family transcription factor [Methanocella sp.]|nr:metalloregulator ArsR/SmtB family transcription factor [Methanocella sp.]